jgi:GWxTD domain-containing protein
MRVAMKHWRCCWLGLMLISSVGLAEANGQDNSPVEPQPSVSPVDTRNVTSTRVELLPCFDGQSGERSETRTDEAIERLPTKYRNWLTEDAAYIITSDERCAFLRPRTNLEWNQFIQQFWTRRSPNPDSLENDFQVEHYRRIAFANAHFEGDTAGWTSDRGRVYVVYGPPDQPKLQSGGDVFGNLTEEGYGTVQSPCKNWHYRYIEGVGDQIELKFSNDGSGNCRLQNMRDKLGPLAITLGLNSDSAAPGTGGLGNERTLEVYIRPQRPPVMNYKDLEAIAISHIVRDGVHFDYRMEYAKATQISTLARLIVEIRSEELSPLIEEGKSASGYGIFGRISKPNGWVVSTFERTGEWDSYRHWDQLNPFESVELVLEPGTYELALVAKDVSSGNVGVVHTTIDVPGFEQLHIARQ